MAVLASFCITRAIAPVKAGGLLYERLYWKLGFPEAVWVDSPVGGIPLSEYLRRLSPASVGKTRQWGFPTGETRKEREAATTLWSKAKTSTKEIPIQRSGHVVYFPLGGFYRPSTRCALHDASFFHHYQGSIDFSTVNIHRNVGMYFFVSSGNRDDIEWHDLQRS